MYDTFAISVSGELLTEIYLQNRTSFEVQQAGGAQATVTAVEVLGVEVQDSPQSPRGLNLKAHWTAAGTVSHWGHVHTRQNRYRAEVLVEPIEGAWKITGLELLEEERIDPARVP